jgi:hypothetical protein
VIDSIDHPTRTALDASAQPVQGAPRRTTRSARRLLVLLAAIAVAPVVLSYIAYYALPRDARVNYGTLLPTTPLAEFVGTELDGNAFTSSVLRGRWTVLIVAPGACDAHCEAALYASRQARTIQNAERERVQRVWLIPDARTPSAAVLAEHPDLLVVRVRSLPAMPAGEQRMYLVDPLGNFVLAWPSNPDIKAVARDLSRLLRASRIG